MLLERIQFLDTEELSVAVRHANVRAVQISRGAFSAELKIGIIGDWSIQFIRSMQGASATAGDTSRDQYIFLVPLEIANDCRLLGEVVSRESIGIYAPGAEHGSVTRPGLIEAVLRPPRGLIEAAIARGDEVSLPKRGAEHRVTAHADTYDLRCLLRQIEASLGVIPTTNTLATPVVRSLVDALETSLLSALNPTVERNGPGIVPMPRRAILNRISEILQGREGELVFVSELARKVGASRPTLQRVFLEWFGLSPARYLMLNRLYLARRRLRSGEFHTVGEVAESCGFFVLSRFSKLYKAHFCELPSQTLRGSFRR